jgi:hypothetical protein
MKHLATVIATMFAFLVFGFLSSTASAHEMVPTYPKLEPSYMGENLVSTTMTMFNKRPEVEYYEFSVFTEDWQPIPFVSKYKIWKIPFLSTVTVEIFMNRDAAKNAVYIWSRSKLRRIDLTRTAVSSRICSKIIEK